MDFPFIRLGKIFFISKFHGNVTASKLYLSTIFFCAQKHLKIVRIEHRKICCGCVERRTNEMEMVRVNQSVCALNVLLPLLTSSRFSLARLRCVSLSEIRNGRRAVHICSYDCLIQVKIDCLLLKIFTRPIDDQSHTKSSAVRRRRCGRRIALLCAHQSDRSASTLQNNFSFVPTIYFQQFNEFLSRFLFYSSEMNNMCDYKIQCKYVSTAYQLLFSCIRARKLLLFLLFYSILQNETPKLTCTCEHTHFFCFNEIRSYIVDFFNYFLRPAPIFY